MATIDVLSCFKRCTKRCCRFFSDSYSLSSRDNLLHKIVASRRIFTFGARSFSRNDGILSFKFSNRFFKPILRWRSISLCKLRFSIVSISSVSNDDSHFDSSVTDGELFADTKLLPLCFLLNFERLAPSWLLLLLLVARLTRFRDPPLMAKWEFCRNGDELEDGVAIVSE